MTNFMELNDLESMEQKLGDILQKRTPMVSSEQIAWIARRKHFDPIREQALIEKSLHTKCRCTKFQPVIAGRCGRYNCRHTGELHPFPAGGRLV